MDTVYTVCNTRVQYTECLEIVWNDMRTVSEIQNDSKQFKV